MKGFWEKLEKINWWLFLFLIPTQLGKHFWPEWSRVLGVRIDYLSPTLYIMDLLWLGLVINNIQTTRNDKRVRKTFNFQNLLIVGLVVVNILVAENKGISIYKWLRIGQWWWTVKLVENQKLRIKNYLGTIIPWWIAGESLLGLAQMVKGGSLEGIMYWLGERRFSMTTVGIAQISVLGQGLIRAYGTFSHPNSLGGFLLVSLGLWQFFYRRKTNKIKWWVVNWLGLLGIVLSGSRTIWLLTIILQIINFWKVFKKGWGIKRMVGYLSVIGGVFMIILGLVSVNYQTRDFVGGWDNDSWNKRVGLNLTAVRMWKENFVLGVGAGNFIPRLPEYQENNKYYWLQPAHNIFLLWGTELGMLGAVMFIWLINNYLEKKNLKKMWVIWMLVGLTGLMDHYWLTLPQNTWLLAVVMGII